MSDIAEAKGNLPLPGLMHQLGLGEHAKKSARCPFHDDKHNSFSVWQKDGRWFGKCHTGCGQGDEINLLEKHYGISNGEAIKRYLELAGVNSSAPIGQTPNSDRATPRPNDTKPCKAFDWHACVKALTEKHVEQLAKWRGYLPEFCRSIRRCVACDSRVTNRNLGGSDGNSALTGPVWCLSCADHARQLLLSLGDGV
jgi:hypothetical protein